MKKHNNKNRRRKMNKTVVICTLGILALAVNTVEAGTLDSGVSINALFVAGGSNTGNPMIDSLKYQMAVDSYVGIKNRYTTTVYNISNYSTVYETGSNFSSISIEATGDSTITIQTDFNQCDP
jgi:hypothetical protein